MENTEEEQTSNANESLLTKPLGQLIADQKLMLELLQRKFEPFSDIPKIAEKIWNSTDDAWTGSEEASKAPEDGSLGTEFLATLDPRGTSITGSEGAVDQNSGEETKKWISEDNLVIARRTLETWIRNPRWPYSSPWEEKYSHKSLSDRDIDRERRIKQSSERWPKTWDPSRFSAIREPRYNSYGNKMRLLYSSPNVNNVSNPLDFTMCFESSDIEVRR
ncbi:hypothetical protein THARTR1_08666 [Trichoderma harzianum]|uniref:Uncharacterized protein n=1 Tax=Trichoderma harzianum TaxID=5544 RepID=A0A2K0TYP7_TRIHA|nr:hypothetical protein THARTR1_08666 [Trichoderma harzianum]